MDFCLDFFLPTISLFLLPLISFLYNFWVSIGASFKLLPASKGIFLTASGVHSLLQGTATGHHCQMPELRQFCVKRQSARCRALSHSVSFCRDGMVSLYCVSCCYCCCCSVNTNWCCLGLGALEVLVKRSHIFVY